MKPIISIIIPYYNAEKTLERCLLSVQNQTYTNFECVLVDNNSSDKSLEIAQTFAEKDTRFICISENRQGVMFASNAGCEKARGEYLVRMDSDDEMFVDRLGLQAKHLDERPETGVVSGLVEYVAHKENTDGFQRYVDWLNSVCSYDEILKARFIESPIANPSVMWRKEVSERLGMYRKGDFPEDYEMWLRWLQEGVRIEKIQQPVIKWYDSETRLTRTDEIYSENAFFEIKTEYLVSFLQKYNPHHPKLYVWGASRTSRKWAAKLEKFGVEVQAYIDIKKTRQIDASVIYFEDIPKPEDCFVLVYMRLDYARDRIQKFLNETGFSEGQNYLLLA